MNLKDKAEPDLPNDLLEPLDRMRFDPPIGATVRVSLHGACRNCAMAQSTLSDFVAERVKLYAPEITDVVAE